MDRSEGDRDYFEFDGIKKSKKFYAHIFNYFNYA